MPRNLVICCDGTNNLFGVTHTSVVRIARVVVRDDARQSVYYDPGVGTMPQPGLATKAGQLLSRLFGLAFGAGLAANVVEAYTYLADFWDPGDRVFFFGFSRGAYTIRVLGGVLHTLGLLSRGQAGLSPYLIRHFRAIRRMPEKRYWHMCDEFRDTYARDVFGCADRRFPVHFLGAFDTVSSVGWVWDPVTYPFTFENPSLRVVRHAVALDERRAFYRQNLMKAVAGQDFKEYWFPGAHSDVGGGYDEGEGGLWREPFGWMISEAEAAGLLVDRERLAAVLSRTPEPTQPWAEPAHESLTWYWKAAEVFPKLRYSERWRMRLPAFGFGKPRRVGEGTQLHASILQRIKHTPYAPGNLSDRFRAEVRGLQPVPTVMPYRS